MIKSDFLPKKSHSKAPKMLKDICTKPVLKRKTKKLPYKSYLFTFFMLIYFI